MPLKKHCHVAVNVHALKQVVYVKFRYRQTVVDTFQFGRKSKHETVGYDQIKLTYEAVSMYCKYRRGSPSQTFSR